MRIAKRWMLAVILTIYGTAYLCAQTNLVGRVYYNANIIGDELSSKVKEIVQKTEASKAKAIEKKKEEVGRELNAEELAEIDQKVQEAKKLAEALMKGMKTAVTAEFKTESKMVMKIDMSVSDDALKAAGIGWIKRKALKTAIALAPSSQKGTYKVVGNMVIMDDGEEKDTLTLSTDGKQLTGFLSKEKKDKKEKFTLTRTK